MGFGRGTVDDMVSGWEEGGSDWPLDGRELGVMGPRSIKSVAGDNELNIKSGLSFFGSTTDGGGVSRESIRPISSIAPPNNFVKSLIVVGVEMVAGFRDGERSGRGGSEEASGSA